MKSVILIIVTTRLKNRIYQVALDKNIYILRDFQTIFFRNFLAQVYGLIDPMSFGFEADLCKPSLIKYFQLIMAKIISDQKK